MPTDVLFHPPADIPEAAACIANGKVSHPAPQNRGNRLEHPLNGLRTMAAENRFEFAEQRLALLQLRRIVHEFILKTGLSGEKREAWASPEASV